jgi:predicted nucleic acid-binding protein
LILVDTNVLLDIFGRDPFWLDWSLTALDEATARDAVAINDIVYAELSPNFADVAALDRALDRAGIALAPLPKQALFLAGHIFKRYRQRGGPRTTILPDFIIGAHAAAEGASLLTRDPQRIAAYFPTVPLISPA